MSGRSQFASPSPIHGSVRASNERFVSRPRTWSLHSRSSSLASSSTTAIVPDVRRPGEQPRKLNAWGSFVPLSSATATLRAIAAMEDPEEDDFEIDVPFHVTDEKSRTLSSFSSPPSPSVPFITRSLQTRPPSPDSSASSINQDVTGRHSGLHPVLARMERASKLCAQKMVCSTCHKTGRDYPRCGGCRQTWCSRQCRLLGGKRHVCPGQ